MLQLDKELLIEFYHCTYRKSILNKKHTICFYLYTDHIEGNGFIDEFCNYISTFEIKLDKIRKVNAIIDSNNEGLCIEYISDKMIATRNENSKIYLFGLKNVEKYIKIIEESCKEYNAKLEQKKDEERNLQKQMMEDKQRKNLAAEQFFQKCMDFHIQKMGNPFYTIFNENKKAALIYVDKAKNINFLRIDGFEEVEMNNIIPYEKLHYYEKAGDIHYTSVFNGQYSSFGGSITGGSFSKRAALISGVLFGYMGMSAGALLTYKPSSINIPESHINISSEIQKIDDRNVILNYYSDIHKQYIDVEMPADCFNFLQTHLPDRKYNIVIELEKQMAINQSKLALEVDKEPKNELKQPDQSDLDIFKIRLEKLMLMKENGMLTEKEFVEEKRKLLEFL